MGPTCLRPVLEQGQPPEGPDVTSNCFDALVLSPHLLNILDVIFCLVFKVKKIKDTFVFIILEEFHNAF